MSQVHHIKLGPGYDAPWIKIPDEITDRDGQWRVIGAEPADRHAEQYDVIPGNRHLLAFQDVHDPNRKGYMKVIHGQEGASE